MILSMFNFFFHLLSVRSMRISNQHFLFFCSKRKKCVHANSSWHRDEGWGCGQAKQPFYFIFKLKISTCTHIHARSHLIHKSSSLVVAAVLIPKKWTSSMLLFGWRKCVFWNASIKEDLWLISLRRKVFRVAIQAKGFPIFFLTTVSIFLVRSFSLTGVLLKFNG